MTRFNDFELRYAELRRQWEARRLRPQQFEDAVNELRFQTEDGTWWQIRGRDGAWLRWDGTAWQEAKPPAQPAPPTPLVVEPHPEAEPSTAKQPQTLLQLLRLILRGVLKGFLWKLPLALGIALLTWILHTYLLVGPNGGFAPGTNALLDSILALQGHVLSGTLFWTLLVGLSAVLFRRFRRTGLSQTIEDLRSAPSWVQNCMLRAKDNALPILLGALAVSLFLSAWIDNRLVSAQLVLLGLGALIAQQQSLSLLVAKLAWSDGQRLLRRGAPPAPFHPAWGGVGAAGATLGFGCAMILPFMPLLGYAGAFILIGIIVFLILNKRGRFTGGASLLVLALAFTLAITALPAFADDGGWEEAGGTFEDWVRSEGAGRAIASGFLPAAGTFIGVLLGTSIIGAGVSLPPGVVEAAEAGSGGPPSSGGIIDGQQAIDILEAMDMVERIDTPGGPRYVPRNLDPQGPIKGIAWHEDPETGVLDSNVVIIYEPSAPADVPQPSVPASAPSEEGPSASFPASPAASPPPSQASSPPATPPASPPMSPPASPPATPPASPPPASVPASPPVSPPASKPPVSPPATPPVSPAAPPREPLEPPPEPKPPLVEPLERIRDVAGGIDDARKKVTEHLQDLPISDETKKKIKERLDKLEPAGKIKEHAEKGLEYIKVLDENLRETDTYKISRRSQDGLAWWRVTFKAIGEATEKFVDSVTAPFTKLFGSKEEDVQKIIHDVVPVKEFGDELSKLPTSAVRNGIKAQRRDQEGIDDILEEIYPRDWSKVK
jgi:hypothetical protein